jgi:hypothetical protein
MSLAIIRQKMRFCIPSSHQASEPNGRLPSAALSLRVPAPGHNREGWRRYVDLRLTTFRTRGLIFEMANRKSQIFETRSQRHKGGSIPIRKRIGLLRSE